MPKKYSIKFWLFFWLISGLFLNGWYLYWNIKSQGLSKTAIDIIDFLPLKTSQKNEYLALANIGDHFLEKDRQEKNLLILFQNNLEIRPGGGFLGSFAVAKIKNGALVSMETHDLSNFDAKISSGEKPPYPIEEILGTAEWKMRDSNFSPNFPDNAEKAIEFYNLGEEKINFDGVIAITADTLTSMLKVTGPIEIEGYPGTYNSENAIIALEYQVEQAFDEQGIAQEERKSIINDLAKEIEKRILQLSTEKKIRLAKILMNDLKQKDIQMYFKDRNLQNSVREANWAGEIDKDWNGDFLMSVDANLGAFKSDYYIKRSMDYTVDFSQDEPVGKLKITYNHTAKQKDWMTRDYLTYLRVYVLSGTDILQSVNFDEPRSSNDPPEKGGKKYFGALVKVPIGTEKTVELTYALPKNINFNAEQYSLKIQKQAGINNEPVTVHIISKDGQKKNYNYTINSDIIITN